MSQGKQTKFYKAGTLTEKGTKLTLKTRPYTNGLVFDPADPITSFHSTLIAMKTIVREYERMAQIPGMGGAEVKDVQIASAKLLLDYLIQSPVEVIMKSQSIDSEIVDELLLAATR